MNKYTLIANDLRNQIANGTLKANAQLPFEKNICLKYDASKMTVKKALDILVSEGLIVKRRGSGTFVKSINKEDIDKLIISKQFRGLTAFFSGHNVMSKVLKFEMTPCSENTKEKLSLKDEDLVFHILRVRYVDENPIVIEEIYMPVKILQGFKRQHAEDSIYAYIEDTLKLKVQSTHRTITVRKSTSQEAENLNLEKNDPVAVATQVSYLENGTAFEYSTSIHNYKYFAFETVIVR